MPKKCRILEFSLFHAPLAISVVQPLGILEDVLVQVDESIFSADFYVLDMKDEMGKDHLDSGMTVFYDYMNKDRRACRDPFDGIR
ncbi:hypothetical protein CR513_23395, partial [Mucuna pruriens]